MSKNDCLQAALTSECGIRDVSKAFGGSGHIKVRWSTPTGKRMYSMSATPSDRSQSSTQRKIGHSAHAATRWLRCGLAEKTKATQKSLH